MANELVQSPGLLGSFQAASRLPLLRQLGLLAGLAASIALGVGAVLWSQSPDFRMLYPNLADKDQAQVAAELQKANIPYRLDPATGGVLVPAKHLHDARLKLAAAGLPRGSTGGFELIEEGSSFGTSQLMETARHQRALEGELARTIMAMNHVQAARVHLALPRTSVFARNRQPASASVLVSLHPGRTLDEGQVAAIVHLVAASVPNLDPARVTVADQRGRLFAGAGRAHELALTSTQFEYTRKLEDTYVKRIEDILTPIIGPGGVRAQVAMDIDFTITEQTQERFKPESSVVRSEQIAEERTLPGSGAGGIPGALSNQPPAPATVPEAARAAAAATVGAAAVAVEANTSRRATRNYELDKTISHTRAAPGQLRRLSVAVVVDNKQVLNDDGEIERQPLAPEEIDRLTALVKDAVGFRADRGDTVQLVNTPFTQPPEPEEPEEPSFLAQPWLWSAGKQALAGLFVFFLVFGVLRPMLKGLASQPVPVTEPGALPSGAHAALPSGASYESHLGTARQVAAQDPRRVAQVVKNWVSADG